MTALSAATTRAWWEAKNWDKLTPFLDGSARRAIQRHQPDPDVMDDIAQETVLRCHGSALVPEHPGHFAGRIARNLYLDYQKRGAVKHERNGQAAELAVAEHDDATPDALDRIIADADRERLRLALKAVPDAIRRPLVLQAFHGRTIAALASQFGCEEGAMKMRLVRARELLADAYRALDPEYQEPVSEDAPLSTRAAVVVCTLSIPARMAGYLDIGTARPFDIPLLIHSR